MTYLPAFRFRNLCFILFAVATVTTTSCAKKIRFTTSTVVPAAEGRAKVKRDNNKNYELKITVKNLADASRLIPSRDLYVVWMETDEGSIKNLGRLNTSTRLFSKVLRASLTTISPLKPRRVFITAENDATVQYPGPQIIIATDRF